MPRTNFAAFCLGMYYVRGNFEYDELNMSLLRIGIFMKTLRYTYKPGDGSGECKTGMHVDVSNVLLCFEPIFDGRPPETSQMRKNSITKNGQLGHQD